MLSVKITVKNAVTGKPVSGDAELSITTGEIPDSEPELENKKITVYKYGTAHVPIGLVAKDGNSITAVQADNADFQTERDENGEWLIWLAKGSINLANRKGTSVVYTPKLLNLPETLWVKSAKMDTSVGDSAYFDVRLNTGRKAVLTAAAGKKMNARTKYKPVLILTLSNGKELKTDTKFTVKVVNELPKVTASTLSGILCTANAGHRAAYQLNAGNRYTISNVTTEDSNYKVTFDSRTDTVYVSLAEGADVAAGKKNAIPCTVYIKDADNTTKPFIKKLKAVVY